MDVICHGIVSACQAQALQHALNRLWGCQFFSSYHDVRLMMHS